MSKTFFVAERMERKTRLWVLAAMVLVWLGCVGIVSIVAIIGKSRGSNVADWEMVAVGTMFLLGIVLTGRYICFQDFAKHYILAVRMGRSKREFLISHLVFELFFIIISFAMTYLLYKLEFFIYGQLGFGKYEFSLEEVFQLKSLVEVTMILSVMSMFAGAVFLWKAWVPWIFWCAGCFGIGKIVKLFEQTGEKSDILYEIIGWIDQLPAVADIVIVLFVAIGLAVASKKILYSRNL